MMVYPGHCGLCHVDILPTLEGFLEHIHTPYHNRNYRKMRIGGIR